MVGGRGIAAAGAVLLALVAGGATALADDPAAPCPSASAHPWCDTSKTPDQRAALLMAAMSESQEEDVVSNKAVPELGIPAAVSNFTDGPVGAPAGTNSTKSGTGLPSASALGATFDRAMATAYGDVTGNDAKLYGYDGIWGPTLNTLRTPLAGRGEEYFGEDPYLIGEMAVAEVQAEQAQGEMVQIKHFVANDQEGQDGVPIYGGTAGGRMFVNVVADERTLREVYLAPFEQTIARADPASVMCSYNKLGGQYACENPWLLKTVLRDDWHFPGFVAPDFGADKNHVANFNAGEDTGYYGPELDPLLAAGQISRQSLDEHVRHILRTFFDHGVFDRAPYADRHDQIDKAGQQAQAQRIEEQGATLLVNRDGALPLDDAKIKSIAVIGDAANRYVRGSGSPEVAPFFHQTLLDGIRARAAAKKIAVTYDDGSNASSAAAAAKAADVAIVVAADSETEGDDKPCMALDCPSVGLGDLQMHDPQQSVGMPDELVDAVAAAQKRTVVVLETGEPVLTPWRDKVAGLLEAWYPGEAGGTAVARVLFGDVDAAGRLSSTFPVSDQDGPATSATKDPSAYPGDAQENETYKEGVLVGYRYYDAKNLPVAFPFGFGLSYTTFAFSGLRIVPRAGGGATVSAVVKNTGTRAGFAAPELYVGLPQPSPGVVEPPAQLAGFEKVALAPGESRRVDFALDPRHLSYWDTGSGSWQVAKGCAQVMIGPGSRELPLRGVLADGGASCAGAPAVIGVCRSRRSVVFHLPRGARRVVLRVGGKRRRAHGRVLHLSLHGLPKRPVRVVITARVHGRRYRRVSTLHPCTPGPRAKHSAQG